MGTTLSGEGWYDTWARSNGDYTLGCDGGTTLDIANNTVDTVDDLPEH